MTLTTGPAPIGIPADVTAAAVRDTAGPARTDRPGPVLLALDLLASLSAAVGATAATSVWDLREFPALVAGWPFALALVGSYSDQRGKPHTVWLRQVLAGGAGAAMLLWVLMGLAPAIAGEATTRDLAVAALLLVGTAVAGSATARAFVHVVLPTRAAPVVVVGPGAGVRALLREVGRPVPRRAFNPVAVCLTDVGPTEEPWPVPVRHGVAEHLLDVVRDHAAEGVVVVPDQSIGHEELRRWASWLQDHDVSLFLHSGLRDVAPARLGTAAAGGAVLLRVQPARLTGPGHLLKTTVDRVGAAVLLVLFAPLLVGLAAAIRLESPGSPLYRQTRIGRGGRPFTVFKLRTMHADADRLVEGMADINESDRDGVLFKVRRDPRITRLGQVMRTYSLDELPQLINVLRGEMSLIGPRPALPGEVAAYSTDLRRRLVVKPGLTGLWQVSGRSDLAWEETVRLDLQYVDNWSWRLDLSIAWRTFGAVLGHRGAY